MMMNLFRKSLWIQAVGISFCTTIARADHGGWHHLPPFRVGDVSIHLDFKVSSETPIAAASSVTGPMSRSFQHQSPALWINVKKPGLTARDIVHVMLINYSQTVHKGQPGPVTQEIRELDLEPAEEGRFTGNFAQEHPLIFAFQVFDGQQLTRRHHWQELVVWINGEVYKDPVTGKNFRFDLGQAP